MLARISQYKEKFSVAKTAKLWFQYLRMVETICMFIKAERTGNFDFHIYLVKIQNLEVTNKKVYNDFKIVTV